MGFFRWLESEQSVISHYFDHHPSVRRSFLEATQRIAGRESLVIPIATPVENALDDEPAVFGSKEVTDKTGLITHDEVKERAYDEAIVITDGLHTDIKDLLV